MLKSIDEKMLRKREIFTMRKYLIILLLIVILGIAAGCARLEIDYDLSLDGTMNIEYSLLIEEAQQGYLELDDLLNSAKQQAVLNGFSITPLNQDDYIGFRADKTITDINLADADKSMLGFESLPSIYDNFEFRYQPSLFQDNYDLRLGVDLTGIIDISHLDTLPGDLRAQADRLLDQSEIIIRFSMPGSTVNTNAETVEQHGQDAHKYTYYLKPGETGDITIQSVLDKSQTRDVVLIAAALISVILIAVAILLIARSKK